jgi:hypothetical protein
MLPQLEPAAERWQRVTEYLVTLARAVDPPKWHETSLYPGWSNKDLLAHLASGYAVRIAHLESLIATGCPAASFDVVATNEERVSERRETPVEQLIEEMIAVRDRILGLMGQLREENLVVETEVAGWPKGRGPFGEYVKEMSRHDLEHAAELQRTVGTELPLPDLGT